MRRILMVAGLLVWSAGAQAQGLAFSDASAVFGPPPFLGYYRSPPGGTPVATTSTFVPVVLASPSLNTPAQGGYISVQDLLTATPNQNAGMNSAGLIAIANRLDRFADRFREGIALAGAINVLPPNPGDRFAVSFGGAGYDGTGAGSIAISARINENTLAYVGYARGPTQNLVKGGVGFSFR